MGGMIGQGFYSQSIFGGISEISYTFKLIENGLIYINYSNNKQYIIFELR